MRFRGKVVYYIVSQTATAGIKFIKQKVKRNPAAMAAYVAARMLGDLIVPPRWRATLGRARKA